MYEQINPSLLIIMKHVPLDELEDAMLVFSKDLETAFRLGYETAKEESYANTRRRRLSA